MSGFGGNVINGAAKWATKKPKKQNKPKKTLEDKVLKAMGLAEIRKGNKN